MSQELGTTYLDGNNIIGRSGRGAGLDDRARLIEELLAFRLPKPCCAVFDGPPPEGTPASESLRGRLRVVYAGRKSADALILERVKPGDRVVTADLGLAASCRARQARVLSPKAFMEGLRPLGQPSGEKPAGAGPAEVEAWMAVFGEGGEDR